MQFNIFIMKKLYILLLILISILGIPDKIKSQATFMVDGVNYMEDLVDPTELSVTVVANNRMVGGEMVNDYV